MYSTWFSSPEGLSVPVLIYVCVQIAVHADTEGTDAIDVLLVLRVLRLVKILGNIDR